MIPNISLGGCSKNGTETVPAWIDIRLKSIAIAMFLIK